MANEEYLQVDQLLSDFTKIRDAYLAMQKFSELQQKTISVESDRADRMKKQLEQLTEAYLLLEKQYKSIVDKLRKEKDDFYKTIEDLKEQCNHLRLINVMTVPKDNFEETTRLQDEIEVLKARLSVQEENHNEQIALLKVEHSDEVQRYKMLLQNAKSSPTSSVPQRKSLPKNFGKNKRTNALYRWAQLNIQTQSVNSSEINDKIMEDKNAKPKKRKLYTKDRNSLIDIN